MELLVTADDGSTTRTYTLTVNREASRAGYCLNGRFINLELGQPDGDPMYQRVKPAVFVQGKGITCDTPPWNYVLAGKAPGSLGVPHNFYAYWRAK